MIFFAGVIVFTFLTFAHGGNLGGPAGCPAENASGGGRETRAPTKLEKFSEMTRQTATPREKKSFSDVRVRASFAVPNASALTNDGIQESQNLAKKNLLASVQGFRVK